MTIPLKMCIRDSSKGYSENNFVPTSTSQTITGGKTFANGGTLEVPIPTSEGMAAKKKYVDTSIVTEITKLAIKFSSLTKAEYNALETKSNSTIYFCLLYTSILYFTCTFLLLLFLSIIYLCFQ